jgi:hypothetical protein
MSREMLLSDFVPISIVPLLVLAVIFFASLGVFYVLTRKPPQ